jgi:hypothetical protein
LPMPLAMFGLMQSMRRKAVLAPGLAGNAKQLQGRIVG